MPFDVDPAVLTRRPRRWPRSTRASRSNRSSVTSSEHLGALPAASGRRMIAFLGSTIGNLEPARARRSCAGRGRRARPGDTFLLGDGPGEGRRTGCMRAYDDAAGVTAEFNRNVLRVVNRELGADFDVDAFEHVALWDAEHEWIEMRLRSLRDAGLTSPTST